MVYICMNKHNYLANKSNLKVFAVFALYINISTWPYRRKGWGVGGDSHYTSHTSM